MSKSAKPVLVESTKPMLPFVGNYPDSKTGEMKTRIGTLEKLDSYYLEGEFSHNVFTVKLDGSDDYRSFDSRRLEVVSIG